ncbi:MAG: tRNA 2-selenouridine(34) synthase MnmH [Saprospiraceae bacterium]
MHNRLEIKEFLNEAKYRTVLDVRTPAEFERAHIPGAKNLPLFSNEERAEIGTIYKQISQEEAFKRGLELVSQRLPSYIQKAKEMVHGKSVAVHCWRGGKRSQSMAEFLQLADFDVVSLVGGYKAYRTYVLDQMESIPLKILVVGGQTGTGKTAILNSLKDLGEQIIDLEGLAHHKGSAFGWIGEEEQPTVESFENELFSTMTGLDSSKRVWVENESRKIGKVFIPDGFWEKKARGVLFNLKLPTRERVKRLIDDYAGHSTEALVLSFKKLKKKLGGKALNDALESLEANDLGKAAEVALFYYDKTYEHCIANGRFREIYNIEIQNDPEETAKKLIAIADQKNY